LGAVVTRVAGYMTKKLFAAYQSSVLDVPGSDCGSKKYRQVLLTSKNFKNVKYRWILVGRQLVCLTPDVAPKYYGKIVNMRSPLYCRGKKLCSKCAGDLFYRLGIENIGLTTTTISTSYMNKLLKAKHDTTVKATKIKVADMFM
jgi:hypothetical protein